MNSQLPAEPTKIIEKVKLCWSQNSILEAVCRAIDSCLHNSVHEQNGIGVYRTV